MSNLPFEQKPIQIYASGLINSDVPTDPVDGSFLDLVAVVDDYQTLRFKHGWYQPGDFEITINKNTLYAQEFQRKRIIQISDDVYKCGVIEYVQNDIGPDGALSELITVRGRELTSYLDRRIINPPSGQAYYSLPSTTPAETVVKSLVYDCLGAGAAANRQDANMTIATDLGQGDGYVVSARWDNLLTVVSNCCLATYSGVFAYLNHTTKKWVLGFSLGLDRTTSQTTNPQAVFSTDRETVLKATLKDMDQGYKNFALVAGQGEGTARTTVTVPTIEPTGIDRRELFVDARDLELSASLTNRGLQKLSENQWVKFLTSDVLAYSQLVYGQDYNVGDQVTVQQFGQTQDAYVTSAEEYWSNGKYNLGIGFDRSSPTLPSQVSGAFSQLQKTMNATELPTNLLTWDDRPNSLFEDGWRMGMVESIGTVWTKVEMGAGLERILALSYLGNGIVLAGAGLSSGDGDIYRSTDYGQTWAAVEMGAGLEAIISLSYLGNGIVLAGSGSGAGDGDIYRSTDYGQTWTAVEMGAGLEEILAISYLGNGVVLAGSGSGAGDGDIYRSTDYGQTWTAIEMGAGLETILAISYLGNGIVLAGAGTSTGDGDIYRSTDYGQTWTAVEMGAGLETILSLSYLGNGVVLAGTGNSTGDGDIYRSIVNATPENFPSLNPFVQTSNKIIPSGYNSIMYGSYEVPSGNQLIIEGTFVIL